MFEIDTSLSETLENAKTEFGDCLDEHCQDISEFLISYNEHKAEEKIEKAKKEYQLAKEHSDAEKLKRTVPSSSLQTIPSSSLQVFPDFVELSKYRDKMTQDEITKYDETYNTILDISARIADTHIVISKLLLKIPSNFLVMTSSRFIIRLFMDFMSLTSPTFSCSSFT